MNDAEQYQLATAMRQQAESNAALASAIKELRPVIELIIEGMKPSTEAAITGVSVRTVSRRRKARKLEKLLS